MVDTRGQEQVAEVAVPASRSSAGDASAPPAAVPANNKPQPREIGGPKGPEPTRYGDWERAGRCIDF
jgi:hypothetical protein